MCSPCKTTFAWRIRSAEEQTRAWLQAVVCIDILAGVGGVMPLLSLLLLPALGQTTNAPGIDRTKVIDLTYSFNQHTIYWPNGEGFRHKKIDWKVMPAG